MKDGIAGRLDALLPHKVRRLLDELGALAQAAGVNVYLVGGFVRDVLMNHRNLDVDLVVEGDGIAFGRRVVKELGGKLTYHERFGTAAVVLPDGFRVDVASARTESYERPAALPQVELGTIRQDLWRRDFTINAMAMALNTPHFGELVDYFGGVRDINGRVVRVLHELSFVDDPTRVFRAARFEQRYGFKMSADTEKLARQAVKGNLLAELTPVRLRGEMLIILSEPAPWRVFKRLEGVGVLKTLHPKLGIDAEHEQLFRQANAALVKLKPRLAGVRAWLVYLMCLVDGLRGSEIEAALASLRLKKVEQAAVTKAVREKGRVLKGLKTELSAGRLYRLLEGWPREMLVYYYANAGAAERRKIARFFDLAGATVSITGEDLKGLGHQPSAAFKTVLDRVLEAKLDGKITTREDELAYAERVFARLERTRGR